MNMKRLHYIICLLLFFLSVPQDAVSVNVENDDLQLQLPMPPSELREPCERASWLAEHYWDNLDFAADTSRIAAERFLEQNFSTWADLLNHVADTVSRRIAADTLVAKASRNHNSLLRLTDIADDYLYNPQSPFADEAKYRLWVESLLRSGSLDATESIRPSIQLEEMNVNPVGGKANDIPLLLTDGSRKKLYSLIDPDRSTLLFFYDPDCHDCTEAIPALEAMELSADAPAIIAVCVEGDMSDWETKRATMPDEWTHVYAADILSQSLDEPGPYILPVMPTLYLLSPDGKILSKNVRLPK